VASLNLFEKDEKTLIVQLPYRVGYWLSRADDTGGDEADEKERAALYGIIKRAASGEFKSAFIHIVFAGLYMKKSNWTQWDDHIETVLQDCRSVVDIMKKRDLPEADRKVYLDLMMQIAIEVARAFQEYERAASIWGRLYAKWELLTEKILRVFNPKKIPDIAVCPNISPQERRALIALHKALYS
jgi:hypothetical protein